MTFITEGEEYIELPMAGQSAWRDLVGDPVSQGFEVLSPDGPIVVYSMERKMKLLQELELLQARIPAESVLAQRLPAVLQAMRANMAAECWSIG